jgi:hypothetical protein
MIKESKASIGCISFTIMANNKVDLMIHEAVEISSQMTAEDFLSASIQYSPKVYLRLLGVLKNIEQELMVTLQFAREMDQEEIQCRKVMLLNHLIIVKSELEFYDMHLLNTKLAYEDLNTRRQAVQLYHHLREVHKEVEFL